MGNKLLLALVVLVVAGGVFLVYVSLPETKAPAPIVNNGNNNSGQASSMAESQTFVGSVSGLKEDHLVLVGDYTEFGQPQIVDGTKTAFVYFTDQTVVVKYVSSGDGLKVGASRPVGQTVNLATLKKDLSGKGIVVTATAGSNILNDDNFAAIRLEYTVVK
jgi:hypothetical protein